MGTKKTDSDYSEQEAAKRRDEALKRALGMPHKPHSETAGEKRTSVRKSNTTGNRKGDC